MSRDPEARRAWRVVVRPTSGTGGLDVMRQAATRLVARAEPHAWISRTDVRVVIQGRSRADATMITEGMVGHATKAGVDATVTLSYWSDEDDAWVAAGLETLGTPLTESQWSALRKAARNGRRGADGAPAQVGPASTPELPPVESAPLAAWATRLGAFLIDAVIVNLVAGAVILILASAGLSAGGYVAIVLLASLYGPLMLRRDGPNNGQTYGKQAMGIQVRREDGAPLTFGHALLREWLGKGVIGAITLYVNFLWPLWDARRQALHDKAAETVVVRVG